MAFIPFSIYSPILVPDHLELSLYSPFPPYCKHPMASFVQSPNAYPLGLTMTSITSGLNPLRLKGDLESLSHPLTDGATPGPWGGGSPVTTRGGFWQGLHSLSRLLGFPHLLLCLSIRLHESLYFLI